MSRLWNLSCLQARELLARSTLFINMGPTSPRDGEHLACTSYDQYCAAAPTWPAEALHWGWPDAATFDLVVLPLSRGKERQRFELTLAMERLRPQGTLLIWGYNQSGIQSLERDLRRSAMPVRKLLSADSGRLLDVQGPLPQHLHTRVSSILVQEQVAEIPFEFWTNSGSFAHGRLDAGTRFLLEHMPRQLKEPVLDLACGGGAIAAFIAAQGLRRIIMADVDWQSLRAAEKTAQSLYLPRPLASDIWEGITGGPFGTILINPPFHSSMRAKASYDFAQRFFVGAPSALRADGRIFLVANRQLPYENMAREAGLHCEIRAENREFKVLELRSPSAPAGPRVHHNR